MLLVLGVLAAVLMTVLWYVISDDAPDPAPVAAVAEAPVEETVEEAPTPEPTAAPAPTATTIPPTATAVPEPVAAAPSEPVTLAVQADGNRIILQGAVPSEEMRSAIAADFDVRFGAENVDNQIEVTDEVSVDNGVNVALFGEVADEDYASALRRSAGVSSANEVVDELTIAAPEVADVAGSLETIFAFNPINFASGSAVIEAESFAPLSDAVDVLTQNSDINVRVEGHTDNEGSAEGNQALSQQRADAVVTYLVENGVASDQLTAEGFGADQPIADNDTAEGRAENRRIEFIQLDG